MLELKNYDVSITMQFTRAITAKNSDYALQKAKHVIDTLTPAQLLETAHNVSVFATEAVPTAVETRRLHDTRDTGWPHTADDTPTAALKARKKQIAAQHSLRDKDWR